MKHPGAAAALIFVCACGGTRGDETSRHVHTHCHDLTHALNDMATNYQTRLTLSQTTLTDQQQVAADVKYQIVGHEGRAERELAMANDFLFCASVRNADSVRIDPLRDRFGLAGQSYREAPDLATAAKAASDMAATANDLNKIDTRP